MTDLDRAAVAATPLTVAEVEAIYALFTPPPADAGRIVSIVRRLCESHERLRRELQATAELLTNPEE